MKPGNAEAGQMPPLLGQDQAQVGHCNMVVHSTLVESRTALATAADDFGQRRCTTGVQRDPALDRILAASGVFGFSTQPAITPATSGFSGFPSAAA